MRGTLAGIAVLACALVACSSASNNGESASGGGGPNPTSTPTAGAADPGLPYVWTCPEQVVLPAGTKPNDNYQPITGNAICEQSRVGCIYSAMIACGAHDSEGWKYITSCICVSSWSCDTAHWYRDYCTPPPAYTCPEGPQSYVTGKAEADLLPSGACAASSCELSTRESCDDGSTGVTTRYACSCSGAGLASWDCRKSWTTSASCGVPGGPPADEPVTGGKDYWIRVEGDGAPFELRDEPSFFYPIACDADAHLSGCYRDGVAPCLSANVTPNNTGTYYDRNGDAWQLTSTSILPAAGQDSIGGERADGVLEVDAVGAEGATLHLVFTFQTKYRTVIC